MRSVCVVGASLAGLRAAEQVRAEGFERTLTILRDEPHAPYDRPTLSKQLPAGAKHADDVAPLAPLSSMPSGCSVTPPPGSSSSRPACGRRRGARTRRGRPGGRPAGLLVVDSPLGSMGDDRAEALGVADMSALRAGVTSGAVRFSRSRNTPAPKRAGTENHDIARRHA